MNYTKPGVTVTQLQVTNSFPLPDPVLNACVIGEGYYYRDPLNSDSVGTYDGTELILDVDADFGDLGFKDIVADSITVHLVRSAGPGPSGEVTILEGAGVGSNVTFTPAADPAPATITIAADIDGYTTGSGSTALVYVGFLSNRPELKTSVVKVSNTKDISDRITGGSRATWFNPLAFAANMAVSASGSAVHVIGASDTEYSNATSELELKKNIYVLAGLSSDPNDISALGSHVTASSLPNSKKERIAFVSHSYAHTGSKDTDAEAIKALSQGIQNKRVFNIYPGEFWYRDDSFIPYLHPDFLTNVVGVSNKAKLARSMDINGKTYLAGKEIDTALHSVLVGYANETGNVSIDALVPLPSYYIGAVLAGAVSIKNPPDPMTNTSVPGPYGLLNSNNYFTETQLNTIAGGGTWVLEERGPYAIFNRHQLSTDATTVQTRELSITHQIDYVSMYLRDLVSPLIGRFTISDNFLNSLRTAVRGGASNLVEVGFIRELEILRVYQSETNPDEVKCDVRALPLYPFNYFNFTITF